MILELQKMFYEYGANSSFSRHQQLSRYRWFELDPVFYLFCQLVISFSKNWVITFCQILCTRLGLRDPDNNYYFHKKLSPWRLLETSKRRVASTEDFETSKMCLVSMAAFWRRLASCGKPISPSPNKMLSTEDTELKK